MKIYHAKSSGNDLFKALLSVNVGWSHEHPGKRGISHFLEHAIFLGNEKYSEPDRETAKYGVVLNGETLEDRTVFFFTGMKEDASRVLEILLSLVFKPSFPEDKVQEEKMSKIIPAVVKESDYYPWELAFEWARNLIFNWDFRYSMGTEEELKNMGVEDLRDWHKRYYHAENTLLLLTEPVHFEDLEIPERGEMPRRQLVNHKKKEVIIERGLKNAEIVCGFPLENYDIRALLLSTILGNNPTSLLWQAFHREAYMVDSRVEWHGNGGLFFYLGANTRNFKNMQRKFERFLQELKISRENVETTKKILAVELLEMERSPKGLYGLLKLCSSQNLKSFAEILQSIKGIAVEDLRDYASAVLTPEVMKIAVVV